ncbi:hypothetical protein Bca4012_052572 [Brassica carinata]|uniref:Uncharacterized protein n=1 Tax=Brassica carinata TaxID=52824 RepID=A0A8X7UMG9_BRACI|nr:hypothetical protein Bca52824_055094 [Brassica carinata]
MTWSDGGISIPDESDDPQIHLVINQYYPAKKIDNVAGLFKKKIGFREACSKNTVCLEDKLAKMLEQLRV